MELKNEVNSKERVTTVLVQILEQYSIMTHNIVENRQEKKWIWNRILKN